MIKRFVLVGSAVAVATLGLALPVNADYPPGGSVVTTDQASYAPGGDAELSADVCPAGQNQAVTLTITPPGGGTPIVVNAVADSLGHAVVHVVLPPTVGKYTVVATSEFCTASNTSFTVAQLPTTGSGSQQWVVTATALVLTGVGFSAVAMRRRRHAAAA